jgi:glycogen phosphorylase
MDIKLNSKINVAYFCMEYGLHEEFRIYAGGLGILAGDILKAAKEMNKSMIGIGILWRQGYTRQFIGKDGIPYDSYHNNDYLYDLLIDTGIKIKIKLRGNDLYSKVWKIDRYDNVPLYLLDTNLKENKDKWITGQLYGWFEEERIAQEMVLGIAGIKALRKLGFNVDVYHLNEGHSVFAGIELIREKMEKGFSFEDAWDKARKKIVFTTHTPIKEGNETHSLEMLKYMGAFNGLNLDQIVQIGGAPFNMTIAGLRLSRIANGVSKLHGKTARKMWENINNSAPIKAITNGVHQRSWVDSRIIKAFKDGKGLWLAHQEIKEELINYIYRKTNIKLKKDALLIGFARRAAPYKRINLLFKKPEVINPYLTDSRIQIIYSGKAHPLDDEGKEILVELIKVSNKYPESVVFLEDYNMEIGRLMTRGVDLWLNNPRRPLEASGTSGIKAAMNGVLNLSILDGWWPEACIDGINGWQFGGAYEGSKQDNHDLEDLYKVLLEDVVPCYYEDKDRWEKMMYNSIKSTYDIYSVKNMLKKYYERMYISN